LGLVDFDPHLCVEGDGLVVIEDTNAPKKGGYVPYSNKALNWHTDGYNNQMDALVGSFSLYCIQPAAEGGENRWIDPEMLYIHFRELNPSIISALSQPKTLTIPERREDNQIVREVSIGPVFFIDEISQKPKMRFTQRKKNIIWLESVEIADALCELNNFLSGVSEMHHQYKLAAGEGIVCNNVIHNRSAFIDSVQQKRKLLRGRYKNSVTDY
jgi:alpha-ketoglutarate-dependent taurine dioxygenase